MNVSANRDAANREAGFCKAQYLQLQKAVRNPTWPCRLRKNAGVRLQKRWEQRGWQDAHAGRGPLLLLCLLLLLLCLLRLHLLRLRLLRRRLLLLLLLLLRLLLCLLLHWLQEGECVPCSHACLCLPLHRLPLYGLPVHHTIPRLQVTAAASSTGTPLPAIAGGTPAAAVRQAVGWWRSSSVGTCMGEMTRLKHCWIRSAALKEVGQHVDNLVWANVNACCCPLAHLPTAAST